MIPEVQSILRLLGERGIILIKKKLSRDILGLLCLSILISVVAYFVLRIAIDLMVISYCESHNIELIGDVVWEVEYWIKNGSLFATIVIFVLLFLCLVGGRIDKAVKEIQQKEQALREEREGLIRSLSHDLRTPLTAILSYSEYMKGKTEISQHDTEEYILMMQRKAQKMKELTNQLLDGGARKLEYIENGRFLMEQLVDEWVSALEESFQCEIMMNECPDFKGDFDIQELRRVFDNLASNVEKYADPEQKVGLKIYVKEGFLILEQENFCKKESSEVESRKIGVESIRKIVSHYEGDVKVTHTEETYTIKITFFRIL